MKRREAMEKLNKMTPEELDKELHKVYIEARRDRLEIEARKTQNTSSAKKQRRYIAQILTLLNSKDKE